VGDKLNHYEIHSLLGQGEMGEVYKVPDTHLDSPVATKLCQEELNDRFEREVGAAATLNQSRPLLAFSCLLMLCSSGAMHKQRRIRNVGRCSTHRFIRTTSKPLLQRSLLRFRSARRDR